MSELIHPKNEQRPQETTASLTPPGDPPAPDRPQLIFSTEPEGDMVLDALRAPGVLDLLAAQGYTVALALARLDEPRAHAARLLNERAIPAIAWLNLPAEEGFAF